MKTNLNKIFNTILATGQERDLILAKYREARTPVEMFNDYISDCYTCKYGGADFERRYSAKEFRDMFYVAFLYDEELPEYVQEKILAMSGEHVYKKVDKDFYNTAVSEIKEEITHFMLEENLKNYHRKKNEIETAAVRALVFSHYHGCDTYSAVSPLITWAKNNDRLDCNFIYKMFEYGYIMGKRAERQKRAGEV